MCEQTIFEYPGCKCKGADEIKPCNNRLKPLAPEKIADQAVFISEGCKYHESEEVKPFDALGIKVYVIDTEEVTPLDRRYQEGDRCTGVHLLRDLVPWFGSCDRHEKSHHKKASRTKEKGMRR